MTEAEAIVVRYRARYARRAPGKFGLGDERMLAERNAALREWVRQAPFDRAKARVLDVGCGDGKVLTVLAESGFKPENLAGIDLLPERVEAARAALPGTPFACGNAADGFEFSNLDMAVSFTVFSSILDDGMRRNLADRIWAALKPGGGVLWYDFVFDNPMNPDVRRVSRSEIKRLFPKARLQLRKITLAPPLARLWPEAYDVLSKASFLRTHLFGWLAKEAA